MMEVLRAMALNATSHSVNHLPHLRALRAAVEGMMEVTQAMVQNVMFQNAGDHHHHQKPQLRKRDMLRTSLPIHAELI